jgi:hypothetical protein
MKRLFVSLIALAVCALALPKRAQAQWQVIPTTGVTKTTGTATLLPVDANTNITAAAFLDTATSASVRYISFSNPGSIGCYVVPATGLSSNAAAAVGRWLAPGTTWEVPFQYAGPWAARCSATNASEKITYIRITKP